MKPLSASDFDLRHIWHPYSSLTRPVAPLKITAASGVHIQTEDGHELIDAMASWWSVIHGYNHPTLNAAAKEQVDTFSHVMFGGLTHQPGIDLCQRLVELSPAGLDRVFLSDSGSVAVDVAMKMALQYWRETRHASKTRFVALRGGYHGDTLGSMSVCDPVTGMHHLFADTLAQNFFVARPASTFHQPCDPQDLAELKNTLTEHHESIAAVILEPIVQGAGGMYFYSPDYLAGARELCNTFNVLLIADEIATGFARTGKMFACHHADITPDILCMGKSLTGGYLSLAATLTNATIAEGICNGEAGAFMHGPTFMGNPLACKIACASIDLLLANDWQSNIARIEQRLEKNLLPLNNHPKVQQARALGAIGVLECKQAVDMRKVRTLLPELDVWLRPFGKLVYTMPPYITTNEQLDTITQAMLAVVESCS